MLIGVLIYRTRFGFPASGNIFLAYQMPHQYHWEGAGRNIYNVKLNRKVIYLHSLIIKGDKNLHNQPSIGISGSLN